MGNLICYICIHTYTNVFIRISMQDADSDLTKSIKKTLLNHLEHRFPVTEDIVCACLLDPGMKRLTIIETYLAEKNQSKLKFLMQMCKSYGTPVRGAIVHKEVNLIFSVFTSYPFLQNQKNIKTNFKLIN